MSISHSLTSISHDSVMVSVRFSFGDIPIDGRCTGEDEREEKCGEALIGVDTYFPLIFCGSV